MSPDPCYCEQAIAYEALLERVLDAFIDKKASLEPKLALEISAVVEAYKRAQEEYVDSE